MRGRGKSTSEKEKAFSKRLGEWMLLKRRALGMSQPELGAVFSVHAETIRRWEYGLCAVSAFVVDEIKEMCKAKGLPR